MAGNPRMIVGFNGYNFVRYRIFSSVQYSFVCAFNICLFVCVEVLWPCQQLRSCRAGQLPFELISLSRSSLDASSDSDSSLR